MNLSELFIRRPVMTVVLTVSAILFGILAYMQLPVNDQPILYIALASDTMTVGQLYDLANTQVGERISIVSGVSNVIVYGAKSAVRIKADPSALAARQMSMDDLAAAIRLGTSFQGAG